MIIVEIEIENYKQFAGSHRIALPAEGAVAVIGHNGAGKTTLFEAIEWALYGPGHIRAETIRPRQGTGDPPAVRVTLQTGDGRLYQVERRFRGKSKSAQAAVYELDVDGEPIRTVVEGPKDVTAHVAGTLVGLSHQAFVATFFTRQKELSFFGDVNATERRRLVSRLLGLETIRDAQEIVNTEKKDRDSLARGLRTQYATESAARDFAAERAARTAERDEATGKVEEAEQAVVTRRANREMAARAEAHWQGLEQRDAALRQQVTAADGRIATAGDRLESVDRQLAQLAEREGELTRLDPTAAREPDLRAEVDRWSRERERASQLRAFERRLADVAAERAKRIRSLRAITGAVETVPGWAWLAADDSSPSAGARRLHALVGTVDTKGARAAVDAIERAARAAADQATASAQAEKCRTLLVQLREDVDALFVDGDPEDILRAAEQRKAAAANAWSQASGIEKGKAREADKLRKSVRQLRQDGSGTCPTCQQVINDAVMRTLERGLAMLDAEIAQERDQATRSRHDEEQADRDIAAARTLVETLVKTRERITIGETRTSDAETARDAARDRLREALDDAGLGEAPTPRAVEAARARFDALAHLASQAGRLADLADGLGRDDEQQAATAADIADLGPVAYDEPAHQRAQAGLSDARTAAGQATEIRNALGRRPALATDRAATDAALAEHRADRERLGRDQRAVGFDAESLATARALTRETSDALIQANEALGAERTAERDLKRAIEQIDADEQRVAGMETRAAEAERSADELQRMYQGFTEFERWVAQWMNPRLADHAGEILADVTDNAYDQVRFDEDYGLHVFDGDESFPVSQFSGGERDVASLAARLALSRLIGAQAAHPPAFVVLDEVFGSLDQERRGRLLSMLSVLTNGDTDGVRQLFVISHVDEVRQSPGFDQVWRITADAQGVSQWENLQVTGGMEEL